MASDTAIWPDDETESETDDDSWFYASVKRYKNLHMFDLQQATRVIEWIGTESICVAGFDNPERNEILELAVPDKLLPETNEEGLCKDRDFKLIAGGFTTRPVSQLKHIPNSTKIVTSEKGQNSIRIYQLGREKCDLIDLSTDIHNPSPNKSNTPLLDVGPKGQIAVFGSTLNDVCLVDLNVGKISSQTHPPAKSSAESNVISQVHLLQNSVIAACEKSTGQLHVFDLREADTELSKSSIVEINSNDLIWTSSVANASWSNIAENGSLDDHLEDTKNTVACLSSIGNFVRFDLRNLKEPCSRAQIPHKLAQDNEDTFLSLQFAPHNPGIISVSGYDGNVCIYDASQWSSDIARGSIICSSPLFIHDGHAVGKKAASPFSSLLVMSHCWHPILPNVVLSAGTDKSLHAWEWQVEPE